MGAHGYTVEWTRMAVLDCNSDVRISVPAITGNKVHGQVAWKFRKFCIFRGPCISGASSSTTVSEQEAESCGDGGVSESYCFDRGSGQIYVVS